MPEYPYYSTVPVSPEAQAYIAKQCENLDIHPTYVFALAEIAMDLIGETSRSKAEQFAVAYAATARKAALAGDSRVYQKQSAIALREANHRLAERKRDARWVADNPQAAREELSAINDLLHCCNPLYSCKL